MIDAERLHEVFLSLPRYDFTNYRSLPFTNGIYIMFEKGETFNGHERIVRVGTHDGDGNLKSRLSNHKSHGALSKNASIFLKNVCLAMLNKAGDPYLETFNVASDKKDKLAPGYDREKEHAVTIEASNYIRENISFVCFEVPTKEERLRLEGAIITTLNHDDSFKSAVSDSWLGLNSPKEKIVNSRLWVTDKLDYPEMTQQEFDRIVDLSRLHS